MVREVRKISFKGELKYSTLYMCVAFKHRKSSLFGLSGKILFDALWIAAILSFLSCQRLEKMESCIKYNAKEFSIDFNNSRNFGTILNDESITANVNIIGLGESTHGDGETFRYKIQAIKSLYSKKKCKVILFESSMLDVAVSLNDITPNFMNDSFFSKNLFTVWGKSKQLVDLQQFCNKQTDIILGGFDLQFSPSITGYERIKAIVSFLKRYDSDIDTSRFSLLWRLMEISDFRKHQDWLSNKKLHAQIQQVALVLNKEINFFKPANIKDAILKRGIQQIWPAYYFLFNIIHPFPSEDVVKLRDRIMAENIKFLFDSVYKKERIILWGANSHLMYNRNKLQTPDRMVPAGTYLKQWFGETYTCISFTSGSGSVNSLQQGVIELPNASAESIEGVLLKQKGAAYFLNMREFSKTKCEKSFISRMLGYQDMTGQWGEMTDGIVYIRKQLPSEIVIE